MTPNGTTTARQDFLRFFEREFVGPGFEGSSADDDILSDNPRQVYHAGILFPKSASIEESLDQGDEAAAVDGDGSGISVEDMDFDGNVNGEEGGADDNAYDELVKLTNSSLPAAFGISFLVDSNTGGLEASFRVAIYETLTELVDEKPIRRWKRRVLNIEPVSFDPLDGSVKKAIYEKLEFSTVSRNLKSGRKMVTARLTNLNETADRRRADTSQCFFQTSFSLHAKDGGAGFLPFGESSFAGKDAEEKALGFLYRHRKEYAVGHGCSGDWELGANPDRAVRVATSILPIAEIPPVVPRHEADRRCFGLAFLSGLNGSSKNEVIKELKGFSESYEAEIEAWTSSLGTEKLSEVFKEIGHANIGQATSCLDRIKGGIAKLQNDELAFKSFCLANRAMLMQQVHQRDFGPRAVTDAWKEMPGEKELAQKKGDYSWRSFQLAFLLMNVEAFGGKSRWNQHLDLIWFPTGGGKTEAYLGVAAYVIFMNRLKRTEFIGTDVVMRYTLRLLTAQQFQRAAALVCACELIRSDNSAELGGERISLGLWVGGSLTPNKRDDAISKLKKLKGSTSGQPSHGHAENPFQLLNCPWCGTDMVSTSKVGYSESRHPITSKKTVIFRCIDARCPFQNIDRTLPIYVIDEDIYDIKPTFIVGTVDKFAQLAWKKEASDMFGSETKGPSLIIQDELHLISGPLGSVVGAYEAVIDMLCKKGNRSPRIIGSSATIRNAEAQCRAIFDRSVFVFPPAGIDASDSYFAVEDKAAPGRVYAGVFPTASASAVTGQKAALGIMLAAPLADDGLHARPPKEIDPYWTLVQYYNSIRELGRGTTLIAADIRQHLLEIKRRRNLDLPRYRKIRKWDELTSRKRGNEIPRILRSLGERYTASEDYSNVYDTILATNMLSVGVDVGRLGLMAVLGQPKLVSEYIQATSRVGRSKDGPGLVFAVLSVSKSRDRSHFEHFKSFHQSFYKHVEPSSVTPFSLPNIERVSAALLVCIARGMHKLDDPNDFGQILDAVKASVEVLLERVVRIDETHASAMREKFDALIRRWLERAGNLANWSSFDENEQNVLFVPASGNDEYCLAWKVPQSMRSVGVECAAKVISEY